MRYTKKRNGKNVIPLRNAVCGVGLPKWSIHKESDIQSFLSGDAVERLAELEDKIEQGTLIELPCPIRTMVYYIVSYKKKIGFCGKWKYCYSIMEIPFELEMLDTYGNCWFLTRKEAEKRLKELQE